MSFPTNPKAYVHVFYMLLYKQHILSFCFSLIGVTMNDFYKCADFLTNIYNEYKSIQSPALANGIVTYLGSLGCISECYKRKHKYSIHLRSGECVCWALNLHNDVENFTRNIAVFQQISCLNHFNEAPADLSSECHIPSNAIDSITSLYLLRWCTNLLYNKTDIGGTFYDQSFGITKWIQNPKTENAEANRNASIYP